MRVFVKGRVQEDKEVGSYLLDETLWQELKLPDGTKRVGPLKVNLFCETGEDVLYSFIRGSRGNPISSEGTRDVFRGTQEEWQNKINQMLASRGQRIDFTRNK